MDNLHHCSAIIFQSLVQKKLDLCAFSISCKIRAFSFAKAEGDLEANINLKLIAIYLQLDLGAPKPTSMQLLMADLSVKKPVVILYDILVKEENFIFPTNFVILNCEVYFAVPIILSRLFIATRRVLVDAVFNKVKFRLNNEKVKFNIF